MAVIKSFTSLEQSRKLAEILPIESADMYWYLATKGNHKAMFNEGYNEYGDFELPCWSLATLLNVLPNSIYDNTNEFSQLEFTKKSVAYIHGTTGDIKIGTLKDNLIDACYELILKLHELKML